MYLMLININIIFLLCCFINTVNSNEDIFASETNKKILKISSYTSLDESEN